MFYTSLFLRGDKVKLTHYSFQQLTNKGATLVEFIIAIVIISVVVVSFIASFNNIARGLMFSKAKTLAANLAQEKIQILKQMSYHKVLVTTFTAYDNSVSPPIPYDTGYFPPENILEGGIMFKRYTWVCKVQEVDGELQPLPPEANDTGMKGIEVSVLYYQYGKPRVSQIRTAISNPDYVALTGEIKGVVRNSQTLTPVKDVTVIIAENVGWRDVSDANGNYSIRLSPGSYWVVASHPFYYSNSQQVSVGANPQTVNFLLQPKSTGTVFGYVWLNDHIVISQVCGSTRAASGFVQEWVELYNPTTYYFQMAESSTSGIVGLKYQSTADATPINVVLKYYTLSIPPSGYYLIANTTTITIGGISISADAVYDESNPGFPNIIKTREEDGVQYAGGGVEIYYISTLKRIDAVGWDWNEGAKSAPIYETDGIDQATGLEIDEQYVRKVSTLGYSPGLGCCYDSDNNNKDFVEFRKPIQVLPRNSTVFHPPFTGTPAVGAAVTCSDGLSGVSYAFMTGSPAVAKFELINVATGVWNVIISSKEYVAEITQVSVSTGVQGVPTGTTVPSWRVAGVHYSYLTEQSFGGYISGRVTNAVGTPLGFIKIVVSGVYSTTTNSLGLYFINVPAGVHTVTANPGNENPLYVTAVRDSVNVNLGQITSGVDFVLSQGGKVKGYATRDGINPIPSVVFIAANNYGISCGEGVSGDDGNFVIINLSSGTYYIKPVLSSKETSTPLVSTVTVTAGVTVHAGTFTIRGTLGKISGKVTYDNKPIPTGVLIIASTTTITGVPPTLSYNTLTGPPYFITSSYEDGTYEVEVIGGANLRYNLYGYYTTYTLQGNPIITLRSRSNITVLPGQKVTGQDLAW